MSREATTAGSGPKGLGLPAAAQVGTPWEAATAHRSMPAGLVRSSGARPRRAALGHDKAAQAGLSRVQAPTRIGMPSQARSYAAPKDLQCKVLFHVWVFVWPPPKADLCEPWEAAA